MQAAEEIRQALHCVAELRHQAQQDCRLHAAVMHVKTLQAQRFAATYADLLASPHYSASAGFFLHDLYSAQDFSQRDAQFARMAGTLERSMPDSVVATALALAQLHQATETLDFAMAKCWQSAGKSLQADASQSHFYVQAWRSVGQRQQRVWQLNTVIEIGQSLGRLTRKPGLRMVLKMMRQPAQMAGLGALQVFLETGFAHFSNMARQGGSVGYFLETIQTRENDWLTLLFDAQAIGCANQLQQILALAPSAPG